MEVWVRRRELEQLEMGGLDRGERLRCVCAFVVPLWELKWCEPNAQDGKVVRDRKSAPQ